MSKFQNYKVNNNTFTHNTTNYKINYSNYIPNYQINSNNYCSRHV